MDIIPHINLIIWVFALSFITSIGLSVLVFLKRKSNGAIYLAIHQFLTSFWTLGTLFDTLTHDIGEKLFWSQVSYIGVTTVPLLFLAFAVDFTQFHHWLKWKYFRILIIIPAVTLLGALTNNYHHLLWTDISVDPSGFGHYVYGPLFWLYAFYSYVILIGGNIVLFIGMRRFPIVYASQIMVFVLACIFPFVGNIIYVFKMNPVPGLDWTPICFMISGIFIALGIFLFRVFDLVPVAQKRVVETIKDAVAVIDAKQRIILANPAFLDNFAPAEKNLLGKPIFQLLEHFETTFQQTQEDGDDVFEYAFKEKIYEFTYNAIVGRKNRELGKVIVFRDITEHKKARENLLLSNQNLSSEIHKSETLIKDLSSFSHMVAHDLKSPLNGILGLSEIMHSGEINDMEEVKEIFTHINTSAQTMSQIIDELLLLSTVRLKEVKLDKIDMDQIVKASIKRMSKMIKDYDAGISLPDQWPSAIGYGPWIEEVWVNLISNGLKYGGRPPKLELSFTEDQPDHIRFSLKDNGDGLALDKQKIVFDEFTRVSDLNIDGHGLGLSIVHRIATKLGGSVTVYSEHRPGMGCIFSFSLKKANT